MKSVRTLEYLRAKADELAENPSRLDSIYEEIRTETSSRIMEYYMNIPYTDLMVRTNRKLEKKWEYLEGKHQILDMFNVICNSGLKNPKPYEWLRQEMDRYKKEHREMAMEDSGYDELYPEMILPRAKDTDMSNPFVLKPLKEEL